MDPNFVFPAIFKNQTGASYNPPSGSLGLFASGGKFYLLTPSGQISGLIDASQTGAFGGGGSSGAADTGYLTGYVSKTETGAFYPNSNPSGFITGNVVRPSETGNFVTTSQTGVFVTGSVVRPSETGAFLTTGAADGRYALQSATGNFITTAQTGAFYPVSNPSGFITGVDTGYLTGYVSKTETGAFLTTGSADTRYVGLTGNQDISGLKDFQTRPTVTDIPVLISGDPVDTVHLYAKNDESITIYRGQPVYIEGANGANPLIKVASNTGEFSSSKTIGLLAQNLLVNELGYVITEGVLEGFDTSAGNAGDPMWLGPTGNILYGTGNKPYGLNNLVYLGVVLRSQAINGKVYVQIQNGFEIEELHNVYALNPSNKDALLYNSTSGAWFARQITTGDVSDISNYALKSETGSFITTSQTGAFAAAAQTGALLTTGAADNRYALQSATGNFITSSQTGAFAAAANTGAFLTTGAADARYALQSSTGNFVTTAQTGNIAVGAISLSLNGGGSTITTGYKSFTTVTFSGEILEYTILADRTGSIVIDVWKDSYGNFPLTTGDSICASSKPTLATGIKNTDSTLTSWTKTFSAGDVFGFNVDSVSGVTNVNLTLKVKKA